MYILFDADTMIFASAITTDNIKQAKDGFDWKYKGLMFDLKQRFDIEGFFIFSGSKGNFRKLITPNYKANRKKQDLPPHLGELHDYVKETYGSVVGYGVETDDKIASYWYKAQLKDRDNVVIVAIDKDYRQFPCLYYNYKKQILEDITEQEAMFNFYEQMIVGDSADNINYCRGFGKAWFKKNVDVNMSNYMMTKVVYTVFKQLFKGKARQKYVECYHQLKLRTDV